MVKNSKLFSILIYFAFDEKINVETDKINR